MISMKTNDNGATQVSNNEYGFGLSIYLNDDQCEALGIKEPLRAGTKVKITALAFVKSAIESVEDDGDDTGNDVSLSLQITDMELSGTMDSRESAAKLYG